MSPNHVARRSLFAALIVTLLLLLLGPGPALADEKPGGAAPETQPQAVTAGELDPTFGTGGVVSTTFGISTDRPMAVTQGENGLLLVGGSIEVSGQRRWSIAELGPNGELNPFFGAGGKVVGSTEYANSAVNALTDGSDFSYVYGAGYGSNGTDEDFMVVAIDSDGNPPSGFGSLVLTDFSGLTDHATAIYRNDSTGQLWVTGYSTVSCGAGCTHQQLAIASYDSNGNLNSNFSGDGKQTFDIAASDAVVGSGIGLQSDGKIVVAGTATVGGNSDFVVVRYTELGTLDTSFGTNGVTTIDYGAASDDSAARLLVQSDDKIVVVGTTAPTLGDSDMAVVRLQANGLPDAGFGSGGKAAIDYGGANDTGWDGALGAAGQIVVAGSTGTGNASNFALAALGSDGALDTDFGTNGKQQTDFANGGDAATGLVRQANGRLVAVGPITTANGIDTGLARYGAAGSLDGSFGRAGKVTLDMAVSRDELTAIAITSNGKIVAAGASLSDKTRASVARYNADGTLDSSFGTAGRRQLLAGLGYYAAALALQSDGKIVLAGDRLGTNHTTDLSVARLNANGSNDTSFGTNGFAFKDIGGCDLAAAVLIQPDGKILAAGSGGDCMNTDWALVRFNANGTLDNTFGNAGTVTVDIGNNDDLRALALQADGKIVVGGRAGGSSAFTIGRYLPNGTADTTFGPSGRREFDFGLAEVHSIAITADGKILAAGPASLPVLNEATVKPDGFAIIGNAFLVARINANGTLDTSFGIGGSAIVDTNSSGTDVNSLLVLADGRILVGGGVQDVRLSATAERADGFNLLPGQVALVLLTQDGIVDPTFGPGGLRLINAAGLASGATSLAQQPDGKIVIGGHAGVIEDHKYLLERLNPLAAPCNISFSDVHSTDFFYGPVRYLFCAGAISGYGDNTFRPFSNTTRAQLAKIVVSALGIPTNTSGGPHFRDVATDNPFYGFIETAYNAGIISGYTVGNQLDFRWGNNVTRGQLAKIIVNALHWTLFNPTTPHFSDVPTSNPFYKEIETAYGHGIISGYTVGNQLEFRWGANATRGQIAKIIYGALQQPRQ